MKIDSLACVYIISSLEDPFARQGCEVVWMHMLYMYLFESITFANCSGRGGDDILAFISLLELHQVLKRGLRDRVECLEKGAWINFERRSSSSEKLTS